MVSPPNPLPPPEEQHNTPLTQGRREPQFRCGGCLHTVVSESTGYCRRCQQGKNLQPTCPNCRGVLREGEEHVCRMSQGPPPGRTGRGGRGRR